MKPMLCAFAAAAVAVTWWAEPIRAVEGLSTGSDQAATRMPFRTYMAWHGFGGMAWYAINREGRPFRVVVHRQMEAPTEGRDTYRVPAHLIVRVFDPEDRELVFEDRRYERPSPRAQPFDVPATKPGVYKIVVSGNRANEPVGLELPAGMRYAYMGCDILTTDTDVLRRAYLYVPRHVSTFGIDLAKVYGTRGVERTLRVFHETGQEIASTSLKDKHNVVEITPARRDVVYRLEVNGTGRFSLIFSGVPGILASDPDTVRTIKAGAVYLDEGVTVQHAFLKPLWEELKAIRRRDLTFTERVLDAAAFAKDRPRRHAQLLGNYGPLSNVPVIVELQNVDPASPWFGSVDLWQTHSKESTADPRNPLAPFPEVTRWGGAGALALAYAYQHPCNPYAGDRVLRDRALASAILQLLRLDESEVIVEKTARTSANKWGGYHFFYLYHVVTPLWILRDELPDRLREAWVTTAERIAQKHAYFHASVTNQWAIPLLTHYLMGRLTGKARYVRLVDEHINLLTTDAYTDYVGQSPSGFYRESRGCDGGYNSMSVFYLSCLYHFTRDERLLASLKRSFELRSLMTVSEPDGRVLAATSFNTRTPSSFAHPFYPDTVIMAPFIAEASDWLRRVEPPPDKVHSITWHLTRPDEVEASIRHWVAHKLTVDNRQRIGGAGDLTVHLFEHIDDPVRLVEEPLPCEKPGSFVRDVAGDFLVIKRPSYYTYLYTSPLAAEYYLKKVRQGGGLSLVWTPTMGVSLFGINADHLHHHGLSGTTEDGKPFTSCTTRSEKWERDAQDGGRVTVSGAIRGAPLKFTRTYAFDDDHIGVRLEVTATQAFAPRDVAVQFPYLEKPALNAVWADGTPMEPGERTTTTGWHWEAHAGKLSVQFDAEQTILVDADAVKTGQGPVRAIRVALPTQWTPGQTQVLSYRLQPSTRN